MDCPLCNEEIMRVDEYNGTCSICHMDQTIVCECGKGDAICKNCTEDLIRKRVKEICRSSDEKNPYDVLEELFMDRIIATRFLKYHILVPCALLTAYNNCIGKKMDLDSALDEGMRRGSLIPPKACGHAGNCGSSVGCGIFYSIITDTHPLTPGEQWGDVAFLTGTCLVELGKIGGPRCCNRGTLVSMKETVRMVRERLGVDMEWKDVKCHHKSWNNNCKGEKFPFY